MSNRSTPRAGGTWRAQALSRAARTPAADLRQLAELIAAALRPTSGLTPALAGAATEQLMMAQHRATHAARRSSSTRSLAAEARAQPSDVALADPPDAEDPVPEPSAESAHDEVWQLVRRAQQGDGEAFGVIYDRYVDTVYRFLYYRVNDRALAEDFTSETFLRALRRITSVTYQGRDIGAWLVTIARNIVLDHVKSARHRLEVTIAEHADIRDGRDIGGAPQSQPSTEATVLEGLRSEHLVNAIEQLGEEQRECVTLRFLRGLSVSETAAAMGKNDGAIKALQHRAVRRLADLVDAGMR